MNAWTSLVNQKLFFARLLLEQIDKLDDRFGHIEMAICQSAVYQLECGYRHHLREVAATYQSRSADAIITVEQLVAELESIDKHPAEAQEMLNLEQQKGTWLNQLLSVWRSFANHPEPEAREDNASPIPLMQVSQQSKLPALDVTGVQAWLDAMHEMVDRHRELMVEC